jgi:L-rhamnose-H+ transport protein
MESILGIIYHSIGGVSSGSFYMPFKKVKNWSWETYWLVGGLFSWLIIPPLAAYLTIPGFADIIATAASDIKSIVFYMGVLWGIGGLTYGLSVRYLGMSMGNSVVLGFCSAFGALVPSVYYYYQPTAGKETIADMLTQSGGQLVLLGVLVCLLGIAITGRAGLLKEKELSTDAQSKDEFSLVKGLCIAIFSGILSSFFNFGIEAGKPMAEAAVTAGANSLFQNNVTYVVLLWGGLLTNLIWCVYLSISNKSYRDYSKSDAPALKNTFFSALAGTLWFLQFFFYGMGESRLGNGASSWILHMATYILTANLWGLYLKEWSRVSNKTRNTFFIGIAVILFSIVLVGIGNAS